MQKNKIYCGDSLKLIEKLDISPNLIIMSPPDIAETNYSLNEYKDFLNSIYNYCIDKLDEKGVLASITTDRKWKGTVYTKHIDIINSIKDKADLFNYKIWAKSLKTNLFILNYCHMLFFRKNKGNINNKLKEFGPDVWVLNIDKIKGYKTKDTFSSELVRRIVLNYTNEGDLILDPFLGTGKTAKVAKELGRNYIGFELEKDNVKIARKMLKT